MPDPIAPQPKPIRLSNGTTIDADAIAQGMLPMFSPEERTVLRFGLLPAAKMELMETALREKFIDILRQQLIKERNLSPEADAPMITLSTEGRKMQATFVKEAARAVTLALYKHGELVV